MIAEFTDRRPALSTLIIVLLFTLVPGVFMVCVSMATGGEDNGAGVVFVYALVLQFLFWLKVERPILIVLPFIMALLGIIASEVVYTVSESARAIGAGPGVPALLFSSAMVTLCGAVAAASIGALLLYAGVVILRKIRELITSR